MGDAEYSADEEALAILSRPDASPEKIAEIAKDRRFATNRKIRFALLQHAKTPRYIALNLVRKLYALELMELSLAPKTPPDVRRVGDEELIRRLEGISAGERTTLARRASGPVAAALLQDKENRTVALALDNGRLTEALLMVVLARENLRPALLELIAKHPKWSVAQQIQIALMRHPATSLARILEYAQRLPKPLLRDVMLNTHFEENVQKYLERMLNSRESPEMA